MKSKKGKYWNYYERIGRSKNKKYKCLFCGYGLPTYEGVRSHLRRMHTYGINEIEKEKREEIEREKRAEELAEQELKWWEENKEKIKEQEKRDEEQRRKEKARKIEMENKAQREVENERVRREIFRLLALYEICGITLSDNNLNLIMSELLNSFIQE